jgi:hypothetical protein
MHLGEDRRRFKRYRVLEGALFVLNHFSTRVGWVRDISSSGLCFDCICKYGHEVAPEVIDLFAHQPSGIYLPTLRCKMIFTRKLEKKTDLPGQPDMNRCGLSFNEITESQRKKLLFLMEYYGT